MDMQWSNSIETIHIPLVYEFNNERKRQYINDIFNSTFYPVFLTVNDTIWSYKTSFCETFSNIDSTYKSSVAVIASFLLHAYVLWKFDMLFVRHNSPPGRSIKSLLWKYPTFLLLLTYVLHNKEDCYNQETAQNIGILVYCTLATIILFNLFCIFLKLFKEGLDRHLKMIKRQSRQEKEIIKRNNSKAIALWKAAKCGNEKLVLILLQERDMAKYIHAIYGPNKWTPVHAAVSGGSLNVLKILLRYIEASSVNVEYFDLLRLAVHYNHHKVLQFLFRKVPELKRHLGSIGMGSRFIQEVVENGYTNCLRVLLKYGNYVPHSTLFQFDEYHSLNILHLATLNGHEKMVEYLLQTYPLLRDKIDDTCDSDDDALTFALGKRNWKIAEVLVKFGAMTTSKASGNVLHYIYKYKELFHLDEIALNLGHNPNLAYPVKTLPFARLVYATTHHERRRFLLHTERNMHLQRALDKICLLVSAGFDTNNLYRGKRSDKYTILLFLLTCSKFTPERLKRYRYQIIHTFYESGYTFKEELDLDESNADSSFSDKDFQNIEFMRQMKSMPLSLQRLCGNVIRLSLRPNAIVGIKSIKAPSAIKNLILMKGYPLNE